MDVDLPIYGHYGLGFPRECVCIPDLVTLATAMHQAADVEQGSLPTGLFVCCCFTS